MFEHLKLEIKQIEYKKAHKLLELEQYEEEVKLMSSQTEVKEMETKNVQI